MKRRRNPDSSTSWIVGGAALAGAVIYFAKRASATNTNTTVGPTVTPPSEVPARVTRPATPTTQTLPGRQPLPRAVVDRITSNTAAREIFIFQCVLFSWGFSENTPDGIAGPRTGDDIARLNGLAGLPAGRTFDAGKIALAIGAITNNIGYYLPFKMAYATVVNMNLHTRSLYSGLVFAAEFSDVNNNFTVKAAIDNR